MSDFIREVDEDYRRDRAVNLLKRFQVPLAVLVVAIVAGAGGWRWWQDAKVASAEKENLRFEQAVDLAQAGKEAEAKAAFDKIAADGPAGYATLARLRAAEAQIKADPEAAAKAFDVVANDESLPASIRDTARFRGAALRLDLMDPKKFDETYGRFSVPGFAFHSSMGELLALAALKRADGKAAEKYLDALIVDTGAPGSVRNRAEAFRALVSAGTAQQVATKPPPANIEPPLGGAMAPPPGAQPPAGMPAPEAPAAAAPPAAAMPAPATPAPAAPAPAVPAPAVPAPAVPAPATPQPAPSAPAR